MYTVREDEQKFVKQDAWFYHKSSGNVIKSNVTKMYESNIGDSVIKLECSDQLIREDVLKFLDEWKKVNLEAGVVI